MSGIPSLTILSEEQKFNGDNLLQWSMNMSQLLGSKGILGYINGTILKPKPIESSTTPELTQIATPIYSTTLPWMSVKSWNKCQHERNYWARKLRQSSNYMLGSMEWRLELELELLSWGHRV